MGFHDKLRAAWRANDSMLCVGLDPDLGKLPSSVTRDPAGVLAFCRSIVDNTAHKIGRAHV